MGGKFKRDGIQVQLWLIHKKMKEKEKQLILHIWNKYITTIDNLKGTLKLPMKIILNLLSRDVINNC